jgi:hypothetical protein
MSRVSAVKAGRPRLTATRQAVVLGAGLTIAAAVVIVLAVATGGCADILGIASPTLSDGGNGSDRITLSSGNGQSAAAGATLAAPLVVTVEDADGQPISGFTVSFAVTAGGGNLSAASVRTNSLGQAQATLTLGDAPGQNLVEARGTGLAGSPVVFMATGLVRPASRLALTAGDGQVGAVGAALAAPFVVTARDAGDNPVAGVTVEFVVVAGGGSVVVPSAMTHADGHAQATLTLGTAAGTNTVEARAPGLSGSPALFTAEAVALPAFAPKVDFFLDGINRSIAIGDINRDGKPDLAVGGGCNSGTVCILLGTTAAGATTPSFAAKVGVGAASTAAIVAADLNGDGTLDLAGTAEAEFTGFASVLLGTTAMGAAVPSFAPKVDFETGTRSVAIAVGDLDGDGRLDLAVPSYDGLTVAVLLNTTAIGATTASFAAKATFTTGLQPISVVIGDLDGDGKRDLAVANENANSISVLVNTTAAGAAVPSFAPKLDFPTAANGPHALAIGDLNGDGKLDLAAANLAGDAVAVLLNTTTPGAAPSFAATVNFSTGVHPTSVVIGDLNGDGRPDLVVTNQMAATVSVLANTTATGATTPSFAAKVNFTTDLNPTSAAIDDFNHDGKPDLAVVNQVICQGTFGCGATGSSHGTVSVLLAP